MIRDLYVPHIYKHAYTHTQFQLMYNNKQINNKKLVYINITDILFIFL